MTLGRHLFLVGFMGAGKTTVGRLVSELEDVPFIDLDRVIERNAGSSVGQIFAEEGEEAFRDLESRALGELAAEPPSVVACGGGIILRPGNRTMLRDLGSVVYLAVTAGEAVARIGDAGTRPLLAGSGGTLAATTLLAARESLYRSVADVVIDTTGLAPDQVAKDVVAVTGSWRA